MQRSNTQAFQAPTPRVRRFRLLSLTSGMLLVLLGISGCNQAGELRDAAENAAQDAAQQAQESAAGVAQDAASEMGAAAGAAGAAGDAAAGTAGSALGRLGDFLSVWRADLDARLDGLQAEVAKVAEDPALLDDPAWRASAQAEVEALRVQVGQLREQATTAADPAWTALLDEQADALEASAMDVEAAVETGDADALAAAADGLSRAREALAAVLDELDRDATGDVAPASGALTGVPDVLEGWRQGTIDAISSLERGLLQLEDDAALIDDASWLATMREALATLRADLPAGAPVDTEIDAALGVWRSTAMRLVDESEAALDAGDAAAFAAAVRRLREAAATAFGPGADFSPEPLRGGEESLPVEPVAGDDDDDAAANEVAAPTATEDAAAIEGTGDPDSGAEPVEQPATLPRTGAGSLSWPAVVLWLGLALLASGAWARRGERAPRGAQR